MSNKLENFVNDAENNIKKQSKQFQTDIVNNDVFRQKFINLETAFNVLIEKENIQDWEEQERRKSVEEDNKSKKKDNDTRQRLTRKIFYSVIAWMIFVAMVVLLQGFNINIHLKHIHIHFLLDVSIVNVLLGTTTISIVGLFATVTNYFFKKK